MRRRGSQAAAASVRLCPGIALTVVLVTGSEKI
jgi:hypothetical protein